MDLRQPEQPTKILMGIGNDDRLDDGAGVVVARSFSHPDWLVLDCATVPENYTGVIKKNRPDKVILVDAAQMGLAPGTLRLIPADKIQDVGVGTHALPLSVVINLMQPYVKNPILFVGLQPAVLGDGRGLSPEVRAATGWLIGLLENDRVQTLPRL